MDREEQCGGEREGSERQRRDRGDSDRKEENKHLNLGKWLINY